jgi:hypothetical protein
MALTQIWNAPIFFALSTDIVNNKISGASNVGAKVYITDTKTWYIVKPDLTLGDYTNPNSITNIYDRTNALNINSDGSLNTRVYDGTNTLHVNTDGSINTETDLYTATGGSQITLQDTTKDFEIDVLIGLIAEIHIGSTTYFRAITDNDAHILSFGTLPGSVATAILGDHAAGEVTIQTATQGIGGNEYEVEVVLSSGQNMELSASLTGLMLTVYLGTDGAGAADGSKNTATAVAAKIDELAEFTATMTGSGGVIAETVNPVPFTGGVAIVSVSNGIPYRIRSSYASL